jgi:TetR/AcrR family transcriptional repressor of nem operon
MVQKMARDGNITRERILATAMDLALQQGHAATSIDEIIIQAGITKGTFFYHFPSKKVLAAALIKKFSADEIETLEGNLAKANKLSNDPLQQLLIFVGLIQELREQQQCRIGCLYASYSYENQLVDEDIKSMVTETMDRWRIELSNKIKEIIKCHPPRTSVDPDHLSEMFMVTLEGAYVLARLMQRPNAVEVHLEQYKKYLESLFSQD